MTGETQAPGADQALELLIESLLFVSADPIEVTRLERVLDVDREKLETALRQLADNCLGRGVRIRRHCDKVQLVTAPESAGAIERFLAIPAPGRPSLPALETLAIVAYRQPVTRAQVEAIRGVNCERALSTLLNRELIAEVGRLESAGRPILFGTTDQFLDEFGLSCLNDLPPLSGEALEMLTELDSG